MSWVTILLGGAKWLLGLLFNKTDQQRAADTARQLGQQEVQNAGTGKALDEVRAASDARAEADHRAVADPDGLRKPSEDFNGRDKDGIS